MRQLSDKQKKIVAHATTRDDLCLSYGAVRSGKTYASVFGFFLHTQRNQPDKLHLITGNNKAVMNSEIVCLMEDLADSFGIEHIYKHSTGELFIGGTRYIVSAGYDIKGEGRIRGLSIGSVMFDEATLCPKEYFEQCIARMTYRDSKMWATCNPDNTQHWLKREWIDKDKFKVVEHLRFDDNLSLSQDVKERNDALFDGVFYERMVKGEWCDTTGLIYPNIPIESVNYDADPIRYIDYGIDYGTSSVTTFVELRYLQSGKCVIGDVFYWNVAETGEQLTDEDVLNRFAAFVNESKHNHNSAWIDPSAQSLIVAMRRSPKSGVFIREGDNEVLNGIRVVMTAFGNKDIVVDKDCHNNTLIDELKGYKWKEGKDEPIKENDHACDALRYAFYTRNKFQYACRNDILIPQGL